VEIKLEQHANTKIIPMILVAPLESVTVALNKSPKIIKGSSSTIAALMLKLIAYKPCLSVSDIKGSNNITAAIIAIKINGILRNICFSLRIIKLKKYTNKN
jgi:hypothetical protein